MITHKVQAFLSLFDQQVKNKTKKKRKKKKIIYNCTFIMAETQ